MSDYQGDDRTAVRQALANLAPSGVGSGWLGVFDVSEMPKPPEPTGDPAHPRCWLTYRLLQWVPRGTFEMNAEVGPAREFQTHLVAWVEPVGGADLRDRILAAGVTALAASTATYQKFQLQAATAQSSDEVIDGYLYGVLIVPSWGGVEG